MAISYAGFHNSPCCIIRTAVGASGDGQYRYLRLGATGCPLPSGWPAGEGTPVNNVFFSKLKAAARQLTGAANDAALSNLTVPMIFFQWQPGQAAWDAALVGTFPDGALLELPFFESISNTLGDLDTISTSFLAQQITFENTGGVSAPTYADIRVQVDDAVNNTLLLTIKIFHSLTT